jgi:dihydrofolate reductase
MPSLYKGGDLCVIISLIVAMDEKGGIGKNNELPWHISSDLKRFKQLTLNHHIAMGRKTFQTIGKPLPGRVTIVISRQKDYKPDGCVVVNTLDAAIKLADEKKETELFIIGGGEIFSQSIDIADKIYLTIVHADIAGDIIFPKIDTSDWQVVLSESIRQEANDEYDSDFQILVRKH